MSTVITGKLKGVVENDYNIIVEPGNYLSYPNSIVQVVTCRSDAKNTYASAVTGNGTTITVLNLTITPKFANSMLVMSWMISGEVGENNMFLIHRDGVLITDTGYESYNTISGNVRYSGFTPSYYDANNSSTPRSSCIQYAIPAYTTNARTYAPAVRGSGATALTYYLNRTVASTGADNQEQTISTGILMEISQ